MNREAREGRAEQGTHATPARPDAGKQTRTDRGGAPAGWPQLLRFAGVTAADEREASAARQAEQRDGTAPRIQRQERDQAGATATPNFDAAGLRATLDELLGEADDLVMSLDLHRATGIASLAEEGAVYQESLRELTRRAEEVHGDVQQSGDEELQGTLAAVQDRLVEGYQRLAITHADETLQAWSNSGDEAQQLAQRRRWGQEAGDKTGDWCGMFVNAQYRASGMHPAFAAAFNHHDNVEHFFTYRHAARTPAWIIPAGGSEKVSLEAYHEQRGSQRSWKMGAGIDGDIRPGDVLTVDWGSDADRAANHTCIVASYTPASGGRGATVVTIDGNAFGVRKPDAELPAFDGTDLTALEFAAGAEGNDRRDLSISAWQAAAPAEGEAEDPSYRRVGSTQGEQVLTIYGRGRPSVVDFEREHQYPDAIGLAEPTIELDRPLQRSERGAATSADPGQAFAAAASGAHGEVPYRAEMEGRFGADFSSVQSFVGRGLDELGASAATRGEQVVFAAAAPDRQTVAHELTHVLQSRQGLVSGGKAMSDPGDASEHEARQVAASLDAPAPAGAAVSAAPSGAIHRQEAPPVAPPPAHYEPGEGNARPLSWDGEHKTDLALPSDGAAFAAGSTARTIYNYYLLENLALELPEEVAAYALSGAGAAIPDATTSPTDGAAARAAAVDGLLAYLQAEMARHLAEPDAAAGRAAAEAIRVPLFRASQQALVRTLNVEESGRYDQDTDENGNITKTYCNVFAYDMVTAMGGYLPRVWWRDPANPARSDGVIDDTDVVQLRANMLYQWMLDWGESFGWASVETPEEAQTQANLGKLVIILGGTGKAGAAAPGHVAVVMAESDVQGLHAPSGELPLQAQAGVVNYSNSSVMTAANDGLFDNATGKWWETFTPAQLPPLESGATRPSDIEAWSEYAAGAGFFVYEGAARGDLSIRTPEQMGLVLPEAEAAGGGEATSAGAG